jgi:hypothetical protein
MTASTMSPPMSASRAHRILAALYLAWLRGTCLRVGLDPDEVIAESGRP